MRRSPTESIEEVGPPPASWRPLVQRVREGLARHRDASADAVHALLAAVDRTEVGRVGTLGGGGGGAVAGSVRAERQRASIRLVEAALGLRLLDLGFEFHLEVLGPQGRRCDFLATRGTSTLAIHVKQMPAAGVPRPFSSRERSLETIERPVAVALRHRSMPEEAWRRLFPELRRFLELASVGEEQRHLDARGGEVVSARILGPVPGGRLRIVPVGGGELDARISRFRRLLRRAHGQFLPEHPNLILFGTLAPRPAAANLYALETALLGTQVERWDRFPRKGHRVAHGRADDGFWHGRRHERSDFAGWFSAASDAGEEPGGWWDRESLAEDRGGALDVGRPDAPGDGQPAGDAGLERDARADEVREWLRTLLGPPQQALGL